ncbi:Glutamate--tRNA ligase mitochondrial [Coemansia sp. RSA 486]|nr:Glutamate--tRNA ligase mitochondrial [Coemansia sp. RSA 486]
MLRTRLFSALRRPSVLRSSRCLNTHTPANLHSHSQCHGDAHSKTRPSVEPSGPVRVRFAPSPTGMLHLGGLRTALFNYLLSRRYGGEFILRIEDTDQKRLVKGAVDNIVRTLEWAGLTFDEGPGKPGGVGPYFQSQRGDLYRKHAYQLLEKGAAYRCFCGSHRLESLRAEAAAQGRPPMYDRRCLHLSQQQIDEKLRVGEPYTIRFIAPNPADPGSADVAQFYDIVHENMRFRGPAGFDDAVLLKSDGLPTYHLANVVDDHFMRITHVLRGEEWLISTPKHRALFMAFGWPVPQYAHLPLLMNSDGSKLSKRNRDGPLQGYIDAGYLPSAVVNYTALLGWHPGSGDKELYELAELEQAFSLGGLSRSKSAVSRDRLDWLNKQHLQKAVSSDSAQSRDLAAIAASEIDQHVPGFSRLPDATDTALRALRMCSDRLTFTRNLFDMAPYLFSNPDLGTEEAEKTIAKVPLETRTHLLQAAIAQLKTMAGPDPASATGDKAASKRWSGFAKDMALAASASASSNSDTLAQKPVPKSHAMMMLRFALTGQSTGPKIPELLEFFDSRETTSRLERAVQKIVAESLQ